MRRLLKSIWTKNGQHWDNKVEPGDETEFLRWKDQLRKVGETSIDRRYFNRKRDKIELHVFADGLHVITRCVQWPIYVHNRRNTQLT